ncbi:TIGR02186 family protein [Roseomonas sp. OT10]|uniref:TIGR02186 family protein n=1 Tax=Roseomonas cutis TaxID=2897332 RepID=UPI001E2B6F2E|nr:TIGR02186 family protein [Roseomonas sp. OT10]UFN47996.1 TIGR02186 family protein [Roseomonas sp. OT10]
MSRSRRPVARGLCLAALLLGALSPGIPALAQAPGAPIPLPPPAAPAAPGAPALVAELGAGRIEVTTAFAGTDLLVFGATERLLGPDGDNILVVAQGPAQVTVVRRRVRVLGIWLNGPSAQFEDVPSWYALTGTAPLRALLEQPERRELQLGLNALARRAIGRPDPEFREALVERKQAAELWNEDEAPVEVSGGRLFHVRLPLPSTVPTGDYIVQVLLIRGGRVAARQELAFRVQRIGTAAQIADVSRSAPLLYGLACVLLAAGAGWLGSVLFRR